MKDYYAVLGIGEDAPQEDIKKAFRELAKKWHPDHNQDKKKEAEDKFKDISEAYDVLGNEQKRREYDARRQWPGAGVDFGMAFSKQSIQPPKRDIRIGLEISLPDAMRGGPSIIEIERTVICQPCGGTGAAGGKLSICPTCRGRGSIGRQAKMAAYTVMMEMPCMQCGGTGSVCDEGCTSCDGASCKRVMQKIEVTIPPGVAHNTTLRLPGFGDEGFNGVGDLFVLMRVGSSYGAFIRDEDRLLTTVKIPLLTALSGGIVPIKGIFGEEIQVEIPHGCQPEHEVRIRGKGICGGDMIVRVSVSVPMLPVESLSKLKELLG